MLIISGKCKIHWVAHYRLYKLNRILQREKFEFLKILDVLFKINDIGEHGK